MNFAKLQKRVPLEAIPEDKIIFYDLETDHQFAPYATLNLIGVKYGINGKREIIDRTAPESARERFRETIQDPETFKVSFNGANFDNIVLARHGYHLDYTNFHDCYLMAKALDALLPAYSLKFINWYYLGDHHFPEGRVVNWQRHNPEHGKDFSVIPRELLDPYLNHDLEQHCNTFLMFWPHVIKEPAWSAYMLDLANARPIMEMVLKGGLALNPDRCKERIATLQMRRARVNDWVESKTDGMVTNVNSASQVGELLDIDGFELELTKKGDFSIKKADLVDLRSRHPLARAMYLVRKINGTIKYFENYLKACESSTVIKRYRLEKKTLVQIPSSFSISSLRTRRFGSSSYYGINFQNANEQAKTVQEVPPGWLDWRIDATQVENIVHIYESEDDIRRADYEANTEWNEYVWLCNMILGGKRTKKELDAIPSEPMPNWSVYKLYKTVKLGLNFGLGPRKFGKTVKLPLEEARLAFEHIHEACPAIRKLQAKVARLVKKYGYVQDVFGHRYSGPVDKAYKIVAYLIQGCGTGSLPKAQIAANWVTLKEYCGDRGILCGTTHDENSGRIDLDLGASRIYDTLKQLMFNMTDLYSCKFANIPLRAKLYLSRTTAAAAEEIDINDKKKIYAYCN